MAIKKAANVESGSITITFEDGQVHEASMEDLSPEIQQQLALHGLSQKLGDSYAGDKENALENVARVWKNLCEGDWTVRGEGGPRVTQLAKAIAKVKGKDLESVVAALATLGETDEGKEKKKALAAHPAIAAAMATIRAEEAAEKAAKAQKAAEGADAELDIAI